MGYNYSAPVLCRIEALYDSGCGTSILNVLYAFDKEFSNDCVDHQLQ